MFSGCTGLTKLPELLAPALNTSCYQYMFQNCTNIKVSTSYDATNYPYAWRIPTTNDYDISNADSFTTALNYMLTGTGGSFTDMTIDYVNTVLYTNVDIGYVYTA